MTDDACYACSMTSRIDQLPPRELIHHQGGWRIAHAFNSSLPGWLVLLPTRHVTALDELTVEESEQMGLLARRASIALKKVTGCTKTYLMLFAEAEGFGHLHVHVVPRMPDFADDVMGPRVFAFLGEDESAWLSDPERDRLALELRAAIATAR
jgi:diadenosine tetraphosphate (Ap4A) HIT family hydrolase